MGGGGHLKFHNLEIKALDVLIFFLKKLYLLRAYFFWKLKHLSAKLAMCL